MADRIGIRVQIGRTTITPRWEHPAYWSERSLMYPKLFGFGVWITTEPKAKS